MNLAKSPSKTPNYIKKNKKNIGNLKSPIIRNKTTAISYVTSERTESRESDDQRSTTNFL